MSPHFFYTYNIVLFEKKIISSIKYEITMGLYCGARTKLKRRTDVIHSMSVVQADLLVLVRRGVWVCSNEWSVVKYETRRSVSMKGIRKVDFRS